MRRDNQSSASVGDQQAIPTLSFADYQSDDPQRRSAFVDGVGRALGEVGFFALEQHPVPPAAIRRAYAAAEAFFDLPEAVKRRYTLPGEGGQRGYTPFGTEHAKDQPARDLKEFWQVGRTLDPGLPPVPGMAANPWPSEVGDFEPALRSLYHALEGCALTLLEACAEALGLERTSLRRLAEGGDSILRAIHYPEIPTERDPAAVRAAAHEDINFITLLCESTADGLELLDRDGQWLPVRALPGQIIVDSGDMLQSLTNGLLRSTTHRVVNPRAARERRLSMPFFTHPRHEVDLTPLPVLVARTGGQPRYPATTAGAFLRERLRAIGLDPSPPAPPHAGVPSPP